MEAVQEVGAHNSCRRHCQPSDVDMCLQVAPAAGASRSGPACATHCHDPCTTLQRSPPAGGALLTPRQLQLQPSLLWGAPCPLRRSLRTWSWKDWRSCQGSLPWQRFLQARLQMALQALPKRAGRSRGNHGVATGHIPGSPPTPQSVSFTADSVSMRTGTFGAQPRLCQPTEDMLANDLVRTSWA